jgi:cysteinyl-tRNA synthetase
LLTSDPAVFLQKKKLADPDGPVPDNGAEESLTDAAIDSLVEQRTAARKAKNFAESDRIRDLLVNAGIALEDGPSGSSWRRK